MPWGVPRRLEGGDTGGWVVLHLLEAEPQYLVPGFRPLGASFMEEQRGDPRLRRHGGRFPSGPPSPSPPSFHSSALCWRFPRRALSCRLLLMSLRKRFPPAAPPGPFGLSPADGRLPQQPGRLRPPPENPGFPQQEPCPGPGPPRSSGGNPLQHVAAKWPSGPGRGVWGVSATRKEFLSAPVYEAAPQLSRRAGRKRKTGPTSESPNHQCRANY